MMKLSAKEKKLEAAEAEATRRAKKMSEMYDAQLASAKQLGTTQKEFLDSQLKSAEVMPAGKELFDKTAAFVKAQHEASLKEVGALEEAKKKHEAAAAEAVKVRLVELRQLVAERQAVGVANGERQRFFEDKTKQLEAEEKDASSAGAPLEGRDSCLKLIQGELSTVQAAAAKLEGSATEAEAARKKAAAALDALKTKDKGRVQTLKVQIDSENSVTHENGKYVTMLQGRLREDSLLTLSESDEDTKVRKRGLDLVEANGAALASRLKEMKDKLEAGEQAREKAEQALKDVESNAASEETTLREQLAATTDAVAQLTTYEAGLLKLLTEGGGADIASFQVDVDKTGQAAPPPPGDESVPKVLDSLVSSAQLATKTIDDNIKAARNSVSRRSTVDAMAK